MDAQCMRQVYTLGHSTRPWPEFLKLLKQQGIELVADVRVWPSSRKFPHFHKEQLQEALAQEGIAYEHFPGLGGYRKPKADSPNTGIENPGFRGYADHMQTEEFQRDLTRLIERIREKRTALLCAEALPWRCHRYLLSDLLVVKGFEVLHVLREDRVQKHKLNPMAQVEGDWVIYPG